MKQLVLVFLFAILLCSYVFAQPGQWLTRAAMLTPRQEISPGVLNYPNPFNPTTTFEYELPRTSFVKLSVFNLLGEEIRTLVNERQEVGRHQVRFGAENLSSGVYSYRIQTLNVTASRKMLLVK